MSLSKKGTELGNPLIADGHVSSRFSETDKNIAKNNEIETEDDYIGIQD